MDKETPSDRQRKSLNALARYSGMAFQIAAAIILGVLLGKWLDKVFSTKFPLFTTIFSILGVFAGVFITIRDLLKEK